LQLVSDTCCDRCRRMFVRASESKSVAGSVALTSDTCFQVTARPTSEGPGQGLKGTFVLLCEVRHKNLTEPRSSGFVNNTGDTVSGRVQHVPAENSTPILSNPRAGKSSPSPVVPSPTRSSVPKVRVAMSHSCSASPPTLSGLPYPESVPRRSRPRIMAKLMYAKLALVAFLRLLLRLVPIHHSPGRVRDGHREPYGDGGP
jgi:hypothetical protein